MGGKRDGKSAAQRLSEARTKAEVYMEGELQQSGLELPDQVLEVLRDIVRHGVGVGFYSWEEGS